jgi:general secretion pathway protein L
LAGVATAPGLTLGRSGLGRATSAVATVLTPDGFETPLPMALSDSLNLLRGARSRRWVPVAPDLLGERFLPCLPAALRRLLASRDRRLVVVPEGDCARLLLCVGDEREPIGTLGLTGADPLPAPVAGGAKELRHRTVLTLPANAVLTRRVSLPVQVRDNLAAALRSEFDRISPFSPEQVVYDFAPIPGSKRDTRLRVDLALCRRDRVDGWLARLRESGSPVDQVTWEGAWSKANLLPVQERPRRRQPLLDPAKLLLALVLALAALALATPLWQKGRVLESLESEVRKARAQAIQVEEVRQELERARRGSTEVLRQKWELPRMLDLLRELTERIPDDTWVQSLEYQNGEVQLRGESGQATALIGLLEPAPGIDGVSFRSPVTQVARTGKERFNLAFNYKPEGATDPGADPAAGAGADSHTKPGADLHAKPGADPHAKPGADRHARAGAPVRAVPTARPGATVP